MKICSKCKTTKSRDLFHKSAKESSGLKSCCKQCSREDGVKYRETHADKRKETLRNYHIKNADAINEKSVKWYAENTEKAKRSRANWRANNSEKDRADIAAYQATHKDKLKITNALWAKSNPAKRTTSRAKYLSKNKDKVLAQAAAWRANNRDKVNAKKSRRIASKLLATPAWANEFFIQEAYHLAKLRTQATGVQWHVDHKVPIRSRLVCGLHCEANLQVIPGAVNQSKGNRHWTDMP